jgi:hypothetical protein
VEAPGASRLKVSRLRLRFGYSAVAHRSLRVQQAGTARLGRMRRELTGGQLQKTVAHRADFTLRSTSGRPYWTTGPTAT